MNRTSVVLSHLTSEAAKPALVSLTKQQGVGLITINFPPVNSFHPNVQASLEQVFRDASKDDEIKAIVITGAGKLAFMGGADIPSLQKMQNSGLGEKQVFDWGEKGNAFFNYIESGPKPTVAAVNGLALGGGLELAMACNARVSVPTSTFGLPELKLGVIPGLGGTQRLPRLIGLQAAVGATLQSKTLKAPEALKSGLIDAIVPPQQLLLAAGKLALEIANKEKPRRRALYLTNKIPNDASNNPLAAADVKKIIDGARAASAKQSVNLPHINAYLSAVEVGIYQGGEKGLLEEQKQFSSVVLSSTSKALIHFFLASKLTSKVPGVTDSALKVGAPKTIAVIGGGTMGAGICLVFLMKGYNVILKEINDKALAAAVARIVDQVSRFLKKKKLPLNGVEQILRNFVPQTSWDGFRNVDIVIEAALEDVALKQNLFVDIAKNSGENTILATNTSTIDLDQIGAKLSEQERTRLVGLHYFSPATVMPLLEIIKAKTTSPATLLSCVEVAKKTGKIGVVVGNCVGFTANRIFFPYGQAASLLIDLGIAPYRIDKALEAFGMPMGALKMADLSGIDIFIHVSKQINAAYGERCYNSSLGQHFFKAGRLGQKSGAGYYRYAYPGAPAQEDNSAELKALLESARKAALPSSPKIEITDAEIVEICLLPVINESFRVLSEKMVVRESDIDIVSITGYGFPAWRGGVVFAGRNSREFGGLKRVAERLAHFSEKYGAILPAARSFFAPSQALINAK